MSSLICGLAPSSLVFFAGRVLQGDFGALIATLALALSAAVVAPHERGRTMGIIGKHLLNLLAFAFPLQSQCQETQASRPALETGCWLAILERSPAGLSRPGRYARDRLDVRSPKAMYA